MQRVDPFHARMSAVCTEKRSDRRRLKTTAGNNVLKAAGAAPAETARLGWDAAPHLLSYPLRLAPRRLVPRPV